MLVVERRPYWRHELGIMVPAVAPYARSQYALAGEPPARVMWMFIIRTSLQPCGEHLSATAYCEFGEAVPRKSEKVMLSRNTPCDWCAHDQFQT